jgi:endonuclease/exonuclease/phosphatase family metal-dependent hydrolase
VRQANAAVLSQPERRSETRTSAGRPQRADRDLAECKFKVASYNIHLGIGRDGLFKPERIAQVIGELDADVICLQEVARKTGGFDMLAYLSAASGYHGIAGPTLTTPGGDYGNAILTRQSPGEVQRWDLSEPRREPRGAIAMLLHPGGVTIRMIATHLGLRPGERRRQIRRLIGFMRESGTMPTVLMGDVNEWFLWGRPVRWLHQHFKQTPSPATFPSGWPFLALDRIWVEPRQALRSIAAHRSAIARLASDHLPITATIDFAEARAEH